MNVAGDKLPGRENRLDLEPRSKDELDLLAAIEASPILARDRCRLAFRILDGSPPQAIEAELQDLLGRESK